MKLSLMVLVLFIGLTGCADLQDAGRTIGQTTKEVTTEIGHATRDATKAIGHASRDAVKSVKADLSDEDEKKN
ncbi:hypothetical protein FM037_21075 [Shewanella psychropiezotolerans]|uniref:Lipoprotein n=1 Tax=Shewanella psychropiezotolerans TaxID=2593655 RepID=A0ABX5X275_9GAMM|nr:MULTISPECIES: hypothetical protein [Shewanella]MPY21047.1 hypothetical protein [Shewanella sp. YLB-07]MPY21834.1 hypothetical protein [Shewanella sp. YLB-07]QDO85276.1 hypothetical protein FM037_21075 [Shewanella psychropiezotolerans]